MTWRCERAPLPNRPDKPNRSFLKPLAWRVYGRANQRRIRAYSFYGKITAMRSLTLLLFACEVLAAQSPGATFEVATVKTSPPNTGGFVRGCKGGPGTSDPGFWRCTNATVTMLVTRAYDIKRYQLTAPDWANNANFEITAKLPPDTTKDQLAEMIRNLLAERFKLEFHWIKKEMPMYDLVLAKGGPKLKESVDTPPGDPKSDPPGWGGKSPSTDADGYPNIPRDCSGCMSINAAGKARYRANKAPLKALAEMLGNQMGMPVSDKTGMTGTYDILLSWSDGAGVSGNADSNPDAEPGLTIHAALQQQLGLKLEPKRGEIDVIVVDKAEKNPAEN